MKKILLVSLALTFIFIGSRIYKLKAESTDIINMEISDINFSTLEDGIYHGECEYSFVSAKVDISVEDGEVKEINILEHRTKKGKKAEEIVNTIVEKQSLDIDTVAGATYSSKVLLKAVENGITKI